MNQKLTQYVDSLFAGLPQSRQASDLREELLANLNDRYEDELAQGTGEEDAFQRAIESLGDLREALGELPGSAPLCAAPPAAREPRQNPLPWVLAALFLVAALLIAAVVLGFTSYRRAAAVHASGVSAPLSPPEPAGQPAASQPASGKLNGLAAQGEYAPEEVRALEVEVTYENVSLAVWDGSTVKAEVWFHGPAELAPVLTFENGTAKVISPKNVVLNPTDPPRGEVKVYLPKGFALPSAALATTSGGLELSSVKIDKAAFSSISGNLELQQLATEELAASSTSGSITAMLSAGARAAALSSTSGNLDFSGDCEELELSSTSGSIAAAGNFSEAARIEALSGKVKVEGTGGSLTLGTTSGKMDLSGSFERLQVQTTSGGLRAELDLLPQECQLSSTSGEARLKLPANDGFSLVYSTSSGIVENHFTGFSGKGKGSDAYGGGGPELWFESTSGGLTIAQK